MFDDSERVFLLTTLHDRSADSARTKFLKVTKTVDISDQAIYDHALDRALDAVMHGDPTVELDTSFVLRMLLSYKGGMKRPRGGQKASRKDEIRMRTLRSMGRQIKAEHVANGESATQAHLQAADEIVEELRNHGLKYSADYLARQMQETDRASTDNETPFELGAH